MRINSIQNNYNNIAHKSFSRTVYSNAADGIVQHKNNTMLCRSDMDWQSLIKFLVDKYKDVDKVHIFDYACSNGSEAYTILINLFNNYSENIVKKFTPVIARDYDNFVINLANLKTLTIDSEEQNHINQCTENKFNEYFSLVSKILNKYSPSSKLTSNVVFQVGDITKDYENLPKENVVLFVRNMWPYLKFEEQQSLPRRLCHHFDKNTTIIIGRHDLRTQKYSDFIKNGFELADVNGHGAVFAK